ncbi:MAG: hypothetical protein JWM33_2115 [Caulobacteraceae bacterium]|nr:hypothetical protein [Caulobacteraceae bacterium]
MSSWRNISHDEVGGSHASAAQPAEYGFARVRYGPEDFVTLLWGELRPMILVFLILALIGVGAAFLMKKSYTASASLVVGYGDEYVLHPSVSDAGRGAVPLLDTMVSSEKELLGRQDLRVQVLRDLGVGYVFPSLARKYAKASPADRDLIMAEAADGMAKSLHVDTAPADAVIHLSYKADNPTVAAKVLNTLMADYLQSRGTALLGGSDAALLQQQQAFQNQLDDADAAYQAFLQSNDIGDFTAAKTALSMQYQTALAGQFDTAAKLAAARAQQSSVSGAIQGLPSEVPQYRDINSATSAKLNDLIAERESLARVWAPGSERLTAINAQIAQLQGAAGAGRGETDGTKRLGANPVLQSAQTDKVNLDSQVAGLTRQKAAYDSQVVEINAKLQHLSALEPQLNAVAQKRDLQLANVRDINAKVIANTATQHTADAVVIANSATPPTKGSSLRRPVMMLALIFAAFTALMVGLLRIFLKPGLPTPGTAARTLDLPVLGMATVK